MHGAFDLEGRSVQISGSESPDEPDEPSCVAFDDVDCKAALVGGGRPASCALAKVESVHPSTIRTMRMVTARSN